MAKRPRLVFWTAGFCQEDAEPDYGNERADPPFCIDIVAEFGMHLRFLAQVNRPASVKLKNRFVEELRSLQEMP